MIPLDSRLQAYAMPFSDHVDVVVLAANVAKTYTVPSGVTSLLFSATADFYARLNAAATVPSADVADGSGSELNPLLRQVKGGDTVSLIAPTGVTVTICPYRK